MIVAVDIELDCYWTEVVWVIYEYTDRLQADFSDDTHAALICCARGLFVWFLLHLRLLGR